MILIKFGIQIGLTSASSGNRMQKKKKKILIKQSLLSAEITLPSSVWLEPISHGTKKRRLLCCLDLVLFAISF